MFEYSTCTCKKRKLKNKLKGSHFLRKCGGEIKEKKEGDRTIHTALKKKICASKESTTQVGWAQGLDFGHRKATATAAAVFLIISGRHFFPPLLNMK